MKKFKIAILPLLAISFLSGCGEDPKPTPSKKDWTYEEYDLMDNTLIFELPYFKDVELAIDKYQFIDAGGYETDALLAVGQFKKADIKDVVRYCQLLEDDGYIQDNQVSDDFSEIYFLDEGVQFRKPYSKGAMDSDLVAVGINDEGYLTVLATVCSSYYQNMANPEYLYGFSDDFTYEMFVNAYYEGASYIYDEYDETGKVVEEVVYDKNIGFLPKGIEPTLWSLMDFMYDCPWTYGNYYSELFTFRVWFTFGGIFEDDRSTYIDDLIKVGYEELTELEDDFFTDCYYYDTDLGSYYIALTEYDAIDDRGTIYGFGIDISFELNLDGDEE